MVPFIGWSFNHYGNLQVQLNIYNKTKLFLLQRHSMQKIHNQLGVLEGQKHENVTYLPLEASMSIVFYLSIHFIESSLQSFFTT